MSPTSITPALTKIISFLLLLLFAFGARAHTNANDSFTKFIDNVPRGERAHYQIKIPHGKNDPATFIPVSILKGSSSGPTVLMVAGIHGYEFAPILAAQRLAQEVDPGSLSGTFIIVNVAHVPAFLARTPYVNPNDAKNLNRSFPGSRTGSQAERIAWALSSLLIPRADFVLDVHSGDGAEWLEPFIGVYGGPLATDYATAFSFAEAMGFPNIVRYQMMNQEQIDRGRSLNRQAVAAGRPTILVEIGQNGARNERHVSAIVSGIRRGLAAFGMQDFEYDSDTSEVRYFDGTMSVPAEHNGIWNPLTSQGQFVEAGEILGEVLDFSGRLLEKITAPRGGFTLYGLAGPPVRATDSVVTIAFPSTRAQLRPTP